MKLVYQSNVGVTYDTPDEALQQDAALSYTFQMFDENGNITYDIQKMNTVWIPHAKALTNFLTFVDDIAEYCETYINANWLTCGLWLYNSNNKEWHRCYTAEAAIGVANWFCEKGFV